MATQPLGRGGHRLSIPSLERVRGSQKRRIIYVGDDDLVDDYPDHLHPAKRCRPFEGNVHFCSEQPRPHPPDHQQGPPEFLVLREEPLRTVPTDFDVLERTASGLSISADTADRCASTELLEDEAAAQRVKDHMATFRQRFPDSKHERILRSIINPKPYAAEYAIDNEALGSIFFAANEIFFNGRLSQRVTWDWSHSSSSQYDSSVIGTTALRRASKRGFETLIVLSSPILQDRKYSRRLLVSTFLHELVHSYLFICCGFRARHHGGHTPGFHKIAKLIDDWAGPDSCLYLCRMEADLESFRVRGDEEGHDQGTPDPYYHHVYPCSENSTDSRRVQPRGGSGRDDYDYDYDYDHGRDWWRTPSPPPPCWQR